MARWYYVEKGKAIGPVDTDFVRQSISSGRFNKNSLIFLEGDSRWRSVNEFDQFKASSETIPQDEPVVAEDKAQWVLLKNQSTGKKKKFIQLGPFSSDEIRDRLTSGQATYADYVWKPGFDRWVRVADLNDFSRGDTKVTDLPAIPDQMNPVDELVHREKPIPAEDALKSVVEQVEKPKPKPEVHEKPPEATEVDLAYTPNTNTFQADQAFFSDTAHNSHLMKQDKTEAETKTHMKSKAVLSEMEVTKTGAGDETLTATSTVATNHEDSNQVLKAIKSTAYEVKDKKLDTGRVKGKKRPKAKRVAKTFSQNFDELSSTSVKPPQMVRVAETPTKSGRASKGKRRKTILDVVIPYIAYTAAAAGLAAVLMFAQLFFTGDEEIEIETGYEQTDAELDREKLAEFERGTKEWTDEPRVQPPSAVKPRMPAAKPRVSRLRQEPRLLKIVPLKIRSKKPQIVFKTDAAVGKSIEVTITAKTGAILDLPSYYRKTWVKRKSGELPVLNLSPFRLPKGTYKISAKVGKVQDKVQLFIGFKGKNFVQQLNLHRKKISFYQQREKKKLFYTVRSLEDKAKDLGTKYRQLRSNKRAWQDYYRRWNNSFSKTNHSILRKIGPKSRNNYSFPETWLAVKQARNDLASYAKDLNRSVIQQRKSASVKNPARRLTALRLEASKLSAWR